jgi:hypothetical protein
MKNSKIEKRVPKGQALLVVLVISTLTLMILLGVASRVNSGRANLRRTGEFDRAVAASDNALNQVLKVLESGSCKIAFNAIDFTRLTGCATLDNLVDDVMVYGKEAKEKTVETSPKQPISLFLGDTSAENVQSTGVRIGCDVGNVNDKFIVTRVYVDSVSQEYKVDKGISNCQTANQYLNPSAYPKGNIRLYSAENGVVSDPLGAGATIPRGDTKLVRVRLLDTASSTNKISIEIIDSASPSNPVASTGKYEFVIVGEGGLGSDVAIKFEKQRGDYNYVPSAFDFVYFGEDLP